MLTNTHPTSHHSHHLLHHTITPLALSRPGQPTTNNHRLTLPPRHRSSPLITLSSCSTPGLCTNLDPHQTPPMQTQPNKPFPTHNSFAHLHVAACLYLAQDEHLTDACGLAPCPLLPVPHRRCYEMKCDPAVFSDNLGECLFVLEDPHVVLTRACEQ